MVQIKHSNGEASMLNIWPTQVIAAGSFGQYVRPLTTEEHDIIIRTLLSPGGG
jgi:hypothetical protein